jgi:hypothetical protein
MIFGFNADSDLDPNPAFHSKVDPDPDPAAENNADPCGSRFGSETLIIMTITVQCASAHYQQHAWRIYVHFCYFSLGNRRLSTEGSAAGQ